MAGRVFVTADLHLGHTNCAKWRGFNSSEDHDTLIITNWNRFVDKRDVVWVLGDVALGIQGLKKVKDLSGIKHLCLGNHDRLNIVHYARLFSRIRATNCWHRRAVFSHVPIHPQNMIERWRVPNIHGHLHNWHQVKECSNFENARYINVNIENWDYAPVLLEDLLAM